MYNLLRLQAPNNHSKETDFHQQPFHSEIRVQVNRLIREKEQRKQAKPGAVLENE